MKRICVFCGSSAGVDAAYLAAARAMGATLARRKLGLVYGGARIGLMGAMADSVLAGGGDVVGVIPRALAQKEVAHTGLTDLRIVESMHERKAMMMRLAAGFVAMPGGFGTLDEVCEALTWAQLGLHGKPCGLLNVRGYFDRLLTFLDHATGERFLQPEHRAMLLVSPDPDELLDRFEAYTPPAVEKLIGLKE